MDQANSNRAIRRSRPWLTRLVVLIVLMLVASVAPYLDRAPVGPSPSTLNPVYAWAKSTHLFW